MVIGVDEAGRGPLAGPVAVGVVAVAEHYDVLEAFPGLADSKKLTPKKRDALYELLIQEAKKGNIQARVSFSSEKIIDRRGISFAVQDALSRALKAVAPSVEGVRVYLDGSLKAPPEYTQETVVGGDAFVPSIMLGALAAKVERDRLMLRLSKEHQGYGFEHHKGYGTKAHYEAIAVLGLSPIHRHTFIHLEKKQK